MLANLSNTLNQSIDAALKDFAQARTKAHKNQLPAIFGDGPRDDPKNTFGAFLLAIRTGDRKRLDEMGASFVSDASQKASTMVEQTGALGGFLVPEQFYDRVMHLATERSVVRSRAFVLPMTGKTVKIPMLDHTTAPSAGHSAFLGGLTLNWTEEGASVTQTNPQVRMADLNNYELSGYTSLSNTLEQDAPGLEAMLYNLFGNAVAWYEDYTFLRGNGVAKPLGVQAWSGLISVARSAASAFTLEDYANVLGRWQPNFDSKSSCWVAHPTVIPKLITMSDSNGRVLVIDNARERPRYVLGGLTVEISEKVPSLNTAGDIGLYDFSKYVIGDRQMMSIAYSEHVNFLSNQGCWRVVQRVGGMPWLNDKVTLADASSTLSPFVTLLAG